MDLRMMQGSNSKYRQLMRHDLKETFHDATGPGGASGQAGGAIGYPGPQPAQAPKPASPMVPPSRPSAAADGRRGTFSTSALPPALTSCVLFSIVTCVNLAVAVPRLWADGAHYALLNLFVAVVVVGAMGAIITTQEMGIWGKVERVPRGVRQVFVVGMCGGFALTPVGFFIFLLNARSRRDPSLARACWDIQSWLRSAGTAPIVVSLIIQACAMVTHRIDLTASVGVLMLLLVKIATEHELQPHVYLSLRYHEGAHVGRELSHASWEEQMPLIAGPLPPLCSGRVLLAALFRASEVVASLGVLLLFHMGTRNLKVPLPVLGQVEAVSLGTPLLVVALCIAHFYALKISAPFIGGGFAGALRGLAACCFCPLPVFDQHIEVGSHYLISGVSQVVVLLVGLFVMEHSELTVLVSQGVMGAAAVSWILLGVIRFGLTVSTIGEHQRESAKALARKVKAGTAVLEPLQHSLVNLPKVRSFADSFCYTFFERNFTVRQNSARLDMQGSSLNVSSACVALHLAAPLLSNVTELELNFEGTSIDDDDVADLAGHLPRWLKVLELNLAGTKVGDPALAVLAGGLPPQLNTLEVGFNSTAVTDAGLVAFSRGIPRHLCVLEAVFYNTKVGDQGLIALANALPESLVSLRAGFYKTEVGDEGVGTLACALPTGLVQLKADLAGTKVTDRGAAELLDNLAQLPNLAKFESNVSGTKVSEEMKLKLKDHSSWTASTPAFQGRQQAPGVNEIGQFGSRRKSPKGKGYCCSLFPWGRQEDLDSVL